MKLVNNLWDSIEDKKGLIKTVLFYFGAKSAVRSKFISFIPDNITKLVSPFLGGGGIEVGVAGAGIQVYGYDIFKPLCNFWQYLLTNAVDIADGISKYIPLEREAFYKMQKSEIEYTLEGAIKFLLINKASFSGVTYSGGFSYANAQHLNERFIERVRSFSCDNLVVEQSDFKDVFTKHTSEFMYLDPPYLIESDCLYGIRGNLHKGFEHDVLCDLLHKRANWILSYNNSAKIRDMYKEYRQVGLDWHYGSNNKSTEPKELLILSNDLPEIIEETSE